VQDDQITGSDQQSGETGYKDGEKVRSTQSAGWRGQWRQNINLVPLRKPVNKLKVRVKPTLIVDASFANLSEYRVTELRR
jgi:hypothetical protein